MSIYCGTSNIVLPVPNKSHYPACFQDKSRLEYYASIFNSIEINSTFYKLPQASTITKWAALVPAGFRFTTKLSKTVTHQKDLNFEKDQVRQFFDIIDGFQDKKGCVLLQFPASVKPAMADRFEHLLDTVMQFQQGWQLAVEFRDHGWYNDRIYRLLENANACLVEHDMPKSATPPNLPRSTVRYLRFHGECGDYRGCYTDLFLENLSLKVKAAIADEATVYAYFNNTLGEAVHNAIELRRLSPENPLEKIKANDT